MASTLEQLEDQQNDRRISHINLLVTREGSEIKHRLNIRVSYGLIGLADVWLIGQKEA